jgi:hypothetical protein
MLLTRLLPAAGAYHRPAEMLSPRQLRQLHDKETP